MVNDVIKDLGGSIEGAIEAMKRELSRVRTGRANLSLLDGIKVEYYGTPTQLGHVASLQVPDPRLIVIKPWEKSLIPEIEKAIRQVPELGLNPTSDGETVKLPIPPLTQERRKELVKLVKRMSEDAKIAVRNHRRDANEMLKELSKEGDISEDDEKKGLKAVQDAIDKGIGRIDEIVAKKEAEILEV
jgi:ribosome recycling factor